MLVDLGSVGTLGGRENALEAHGALGLVRAAVGTPVECCAAALGAPRTEPPRREQGGPTEVQVGVGQHGHRATLRAPRPRAPGRPGTPSGSGKVVPSSTVYGAGAMGSTPRR